MKLTIELIPEKAWNKSLFRIMKRSDWNKIKKDLFEKEGRKCWICGTENQLEAHEFWTYNDKKKVQKLEAIHHLCQLCHKVKHIGFWTGTEDGKVKLKKFGLTENDLINHFCKINACSKERFQKEKNKSMKVFFQRINIEWKQDFGKYSNLVSKLGIY